MAAGNEAGSQDKMTPESLGALSWVLSVAFSPVKETQCVGGGQRECGRGVHVTWAVGDKLNTQAQAAFWPMWEWNWQPYSSELNSNQLSYPGHPERFTFKIVQTV